MCVNFDRLHKNNCSQLVNRCGHRIIAHPLFGLNSLGKPKRGPEHIVVWRLANQGIPIPKGYCIHHIDKNKLNNDIDNLILLGIGEHSRIHSKERVGMKYS